MRFRRFVRRIILLAALPLLVLAIPATALANTALANTALANTAFANTASAAAATASTAATAATGTGWIRLAHFSPNTPAVDVYLYSFGDTSAETVLHHVAYGDASPYEQVPTGDYTVAMRAAGASATSSPVLSASVDVVAGHAYTVAGLGPESGLRLQVLDDQLNTPTGKALVRIIQASLKQNAVSVSWGGTMLKSKLAFGSVTSYQTVSPGTETLLVTGSGEDAKVSIPLAAGTVHTLVVLDGAKGLQVDDLIDAAGSATDPLGGAATGFGGMAPRAPSSPLPWLAGIGAGLLLAVAGGRRLRRLRAARS
jgi:Domain of unknown function (DUF4397)